MLMQNVLYNTNKQPIFIKKLANKKLELLPTLKCYHK